MNKHKIATREGWRKARIELLKKEKEHMKRGDRLTKKRQALPWVVIEKEYVFQTNDGEKTLAELSMIVLN